jgi:hypothetical protein
MNPRLIEPGFAVVCLHADVPARPGKDENREDDARVARQHLRGQDTCTAIHCARPGTSRQRIEPDALSKIGWAPSSRVGLLIHQRWGMERESTPFGACRQYSGTFRVAQGRSIRSSRQIEVRNRYTKRLARYHAGA